MTSHHRFPTIGHRAAVLLAAPLLALATGLGGCGHTTGDAPPTDPRQQELRFAQCMREHGVDMPDPDPDSDTATTGLTGGDGAAQALAACRRYLPDAGKPRPKTEQERAEELAFARCMREHGIDYPDPAADGQNAMPAVDLGDARQVAAVEACRQAGPSAKPSK